MEITLYIKAEKRKTQTLSSLLHEQYHLPSGTLSRMKFDGTLLIWQQRPVFLNEKITQSGWLKLFVPEAKSEVWPVPGVMDVIYEDEYLLAVEKKAGQVMHPCHGHYFDTLANQVAAYLQGDKVCSLGRLDEDTSGIVVYAKHSLIASMLENRPLKKTYLAIVHGVIKEKSFTIDAPIAPCANKINRFEISAQGKRCVSHVRVIETYENACLVALQLETGRSHQIRVHMQSIGHPLFGDPFYGIEDDFGRTALHVCRLDGVHPIHHEPLHLSCMMPQDMQQLRSKLIENKKTA